MPSELSAGLGKALCRSAPVGGTAALGTWSHHVGHLSWGAHVGRARACSLGIEEQRAVPAPEPCPTPTSRSKYVAQATKIRGLLWWNVIDKWTIRGQMCRLT